MLQINIGEYEDPEVEAAFRVLVEISVLLSSFGERIMLVGGWIPELFHPQEGHIGSLDADFLIDHKRLQEAEYTTIERLLVGKGYQRHPDPQKYFTYIKTVDISGQSITVDVDFLAGKYWGTGTNRHSQHVQGIKALKASGGDFAMSAGCNSIKVINGRRTDGALVNTEIHIVSLPGFLVMKAYAMKGRAKNKDAFEQVQAFLKEMRKLAQMLAE